jgi:hypothetical protein
MGFNERYDDVSTNSFTIPDTLPDDTAIEVEIDAMDAVHPGDIDATMDGRDNWFIVDSGGDSTITFSGTITNNSGATGPYYLETRNERDRMATLVLPSSANSYSILALAGSSGDRVRLSAWIDVDGTGVDDSDGNQGYRINLDAADASVDQSNFNITFNPPVLLVAPANGAQLTSVTPVFSWEDYSASAPAGPWSYLLFVFEESAEGAEGSNAIYGFADTTTSFDMANPPSGTGAFDINLPRTCLEASGVWADGGCQGQTAIASVSDLSSSTGWEWGIIVVECDYQDFVDGVDSDSNMINDYTDCIFELLGDEGQGGYAESATNDFMTP